MTLTLDLTPILEKRLTELAADQGLPVEQYTLTLLESHLPAESRATALSALFDSWINHGDAEEQKETGEYLIRVLDEDRLSDRKLFPLEKKGQTW